jgi:aryl-alcohol dehydrogenase-like predicted oxidoreductase
LDKSGTDTNRRRVLQAGLAGCAAIATAATPLEAFARPVQVATRRIPRSGERLPVIGTGSVHVYGWVAAEEPVKLAECRTVLETLIHGGGKVLDTAADYGGAEDAQGVILQASGIRPKLFIATKVGARHGKNVAAALADMQRSHERLRVTQTDLLQLHDLTDPDTDLAFMRDWKAQGKTRYIGITTVYREAYDAILATLLREKPDFLQIDLSIEDRDVEERILPAAAHQGTAVIVNLPFASGNLFKAVAGRNLPPWAAEFDITTWAQYFLKFILANPAVTCVIPGTARPSYMLDNLEAGRGPLPNARQRLRMIEYFNEVRVT